MGSGVKIEKAGLENAAEILELQKLAYQSEASLYNDFRIPPLIQTLEEMENDFLDQEILKAWVGRKTVGSVRARLKKGTCFIGRLIVHPDFQNQGIGTRLILAMENHFSGAERFELFTGHKSDRNLHLYEKMGYRVFKRENISEKLTLLFMEKTAKFFKPVADPQ